MINRMLVAALVGVLNAGVWAMDGEGPKSETPGDKVAYSLGYQIGQDFKGQGVEVRTDAVSRGVSDGLTGASPLLPSDQMRRTLLELKRRIMSRSALEARKQTAMARAQDEQFLVENAKKDAVVSLPSGLQYRVLRTGTGQRPVLESRVKVRYRASLINGVDFDDTESEGGSVQLDVREVIPGLREGLQLMREGAHWQLFIPPNLGYGVRGPLANRAVVFDLELLGVQGERVTEVTRSQAGNVQ